MSEFIGSRISLISKSDIRYVGTLHEINSENSTVALEQVSSFGTEGRKSNKDEEIAGSDSVYEYIIFRGSDVKDLRIEEPPKENKPPPPQVPNDPAILGAGSRTQPHNPLSQHMPPGPNGRRGGPPHHFQQAPPFLNYPQYNQHQQAPRFGGPQGSSGTGFHGPPGEFHTYSGMPPYGAPPGWYPPQGHGFPPPLPGSFPPPHQQMSFGAPAPHPHILKNGQQQPLQPESGKPPVSAPSPAVVEQKILLKRPIADTRVPAAAKADIQKNSKMTPAAVGLVTQGPPPPMESKPDVAVALIDSANAAATLSNQAIDTSKTIPVAVKGGKVVPVVPFAGPTVKQNAKKVSPLQASTGNTKQPDATEPGQAAVSAALQYQNATQAATAAVAAAMAKLPKVATQKPRQTSGNDAMDNLSQKMNALKTDNVPRQSLQSGMRVHTGAYRGGGRGVAGRGRGGRDKHQSKGLDIPTADFDFESANAKFNKQDLVKEAIASGSPLEMPNQVNEADTLSNGVSGNEQAEPKNDGVGEVVIPAAATIYNKSTSFFDNISSEARDGRDEAADGKRRPSGQEFRSEERKRNMETFGMGSVESGSGYRGRGSGRGRGGYRGGYRGVRVEHGNADGTIYGGAMRGRGRSMAPTHAVATGI